MQQAAYAESLDFAAMATARDRLRGPKGVA